MSTGSTLPCGQGQAPFRKMLIVPTLRMGMPPVTLRVTLRDAERPWLHSHAERGNDRRFLWERAGSLPQVRNLLNNRDRRASDTCRPASSLSGTSGSHPLAV
ncbi:hypothetical protein EGJ55_11220 [Pseudomonas moraviensis]|nr:hypothetical protein EGJ55_11220 [Pseudomonas moraviensis]